MEKKVIAIYARKSKATDKGESLKVQIEKCKQHVGYKYSDYQLEFLIYEEKEGKSGANLDREKFKELMNDIADQSKGINALLVYKLDRLTRSVLDFSEIYQVLNLYGTEFISVKEEFDTTTSTGRAMLTISVVFAQLEREMIAERIQDSMLELAKTGRWLGGTTPLGYLSKLENYVNDAGQCKTKNHLENIPEEAVIVQKIYESYLDLGSLTKLEAYFMKEKYKTRKDFDFKLYSLRFILNNPVYCCADSQAYEYFHKNGYQIYSPKETFDGQYGVIAYNKTVSMKKGDANLENTVSRWRKKEDWIIAVGKHEPLITSNDWIKVQKLLEANKSKSYRHARTTDALLSGLIKCQCGGNMRPKTSGSRTYDGVKAFYYLCENKERKKCCQVANIPGNLLDKLVVEKIFSLCKEITPSYHIPEKQKINMANKQTYYIDQKDYIKRNIDKIERQLNNINTAILNAKDELAIHKFTEQYEILLKEKSKLEVKFKQNIHNELFDYDEKLLIRLLSSFDENLWRELSYVQKKYVIRALIKKIEWDGRRAHVYFVGNNTAKLKEEQMSF